MNLNSMYQDFGNGREKQNPAAIEVDLETLEDNKLQAFENGYQAGWDDAVKAQEGLEKSVSSALAANLQDASFSFHESRQLMQKTVQDMMKHVVDVLLPSIARQSLGMHVCQQVENFSRDSLAGNIELVVHPDAVKTVDQLLSHVSEKYNVVGDSNTQLDQAFIRVSEAEQKVDLGEVVREIDVAVSEYFQAQLPEVQK